MKLTDELGEGIYGKVYEIDGEKAVKVVSENSFNFPLLNEIEFFRRVKHPRIVSGRIILPKEEPTNISRKGYGIEMEKAIFSLDKVFKRSEEKKLHFSREQRLVCWYQMVHAIAAVHAAGRLHLDLKPQNVLVFGKNDYRLCDFGLGAHGKKHMSDHWLISLDYRSPENLKSVCSFYTPASDVWSLGILGVWILSGGKSLYEEKSKEKRLLNEIKDSVPKLESMLKRKINSEYHDLIGLFMRILSYDPEKRPSAEEILKEGSYSFIPPTIYTPPSLSVEPNQELLKESFRLLNTLDVPAESMPDAYERIRYIVQHVTPYYIGRAEELQDSALAIDMVALHAMGYFQQVPNRLIDRMWVIVERCDFIFM